MLILVYSAVKLNQMLKRFMLSNQLFIEHCNLPIFKLGFLFFLYTVGGSKSNRAYWPNFVQDTDLLIYVVDSADEHKLAESVKELHILVACDKLKNVPIFILANKQVSDLLYNFHNYIVNTVKTYDTSSYSISCQFCSKYQFKTVKT